MKGIPIILTRQDTMTVLEQIEKFFGETRFHQEKKMRRFDTLLNQHMDFNGLKRSLGLFLQEEIFTYDITDKQNEKRLHNWTRI